MPLRLLPCGLLVSGFGSFLMITLLSLEGFKPWNMNGLKKLTPGKPAEGGKNLTRRILFCLA